MAFYRNQMDQYYDPQPNYGNYNYSNQGYYSRPNPRQMRMLPGKFIQNETDIRPNDVPGDGSVAFFPEENYNYIIAKGWNNQGDRMDVVKYVPEQRANPEPQVSPEMQMLQAIMQRQDRIEQMLIASGLFVEEKKNEPVEEKEDKK